MTIPSAPGVFDILPFESDEAWRSSYLWNYIESIIRQTARDYGYQEIRTPIFERTELFVRGVGSTSDIVTKEMYTFNDKGERSLTLRPEGTAPVIRAFIEHKMYTQAPIHKLFYIGPMFRYERAQLGRYRQHHQFGAEAIGISSPEQDAELIDLVYTVYQKLGLKNLQVNINSIGTPDTRKAFREALQDYLRKDLENLSEDSQRRFSTNPLRILDSKDPRDQEIVKNAPNILNYLDDESALHFQKLQKLLDTLKIPYQVNPLLVRGLDYYNKTVFEITAGQLGAQNSVGGGGRYDGLMKDLGGPDLPTIGFGTGLERILQTMLRHESPKPKAPTPEVYLIPLGDQAKEACFSMLHDLRKQGIPSDMDLSGRKLGKVMQYANQIQTRYVLIVGDEELKTNSAQLKDMSTGHLTPIALDHLAKTLSLDIKNNTIIQLMNEMTQAMQDPHEVDFYMQNLENNIEKTQTMISDLKDTMEKFKKITD